MLLLYILLLWPFTITAALLGCLWHKAQKKQRQFNLKHLPAVEDEHPDAEAAARNDHNKRQKPLPKFRVEPTTAKMPPPVAHSDEDLLKADEDNIQFETGDNKQNKEGKKDKNVIRFAGTGHMYFVAEMDEVRGGICDDPNSDQSADTLGTETQQSSSASQTGSSDSKNSPK